eukprot:UN08128
MRKRFHLSLRICRENLEVVRKNKRKLIARSYLTVGCQNYFPPH